MFTDIKDENKRTLSFIEGKTTLSEVMHMFSKQLGREYKPMVFGSHYLSYTLSGYFESFDITYTNRYGESYTHNASGGGEYFINLRFDDLCVGTNKVVKRVVSGMDVSGMDVVDVNASKRQYQS